MVKMSSYNAMIGIAEITKNKVKQIKQIKETKLTKDEEQVIIYLTNQFYDKIKNSIHDSANIGRSYCILEIDDQYFSIAFNAFDWDFNKSKILSSPNSIAWKWMRFLTQKNNQNLKVNNKIVEYFGPPLCYRIIPKDHYIEKFYDWGAFYKKCQDIRKSVIIELRWDSLNEKKKKYYKVVE
jgi:hypothetical protein